MHIHLNYSPLLTSLAAERVETREIQAKRAAEVRRKLSSASRVLGDFKEPFDIAPRIERRAYDSESRPAEDDSFGKLFSATA